MMLNALECISLTIVNINYTLIRSANKGFSENMKVFM